jgi:hypothetical protein
MRSIKSFFISLVILLATIAGGTWAAYVPSAELLPEAGTECPPLVIEKFPKAPALIIDNGNSVVVVFCGVGQPQTIKQGEKTLTILFARCTAA